jgi:hypothetical protein
MGSYRVVRRYFDRNREPIIGDPAVSGVLRSRPLRSGGFSAIEPSICSPTDGKGKIKLAICLTRRICCIDTFEPHLNAIEKPR